MEKFTARGAVKRVLTTIVHTKVSGYTKDTITDYTEFEDGDLFVAISGNLVGWAVSSNLKPYTDKMVDKTFDFIAAKRAERKTKLEEAKKEEKE